jgi:hypothetical protein
MKRGQNKSFFHYRVETYDDNEELLLSKLYKTRDEISNEYNCSIRNIAYNIDKGIKKKGKLKNISILYHKEPVYNYEIRSDIIFDANVD